MDKGPMMPKLEEALHKAWNSEGGMCIDSHPCNSRPDYWHVVVCPAVRELMGGELDGQQVYARCRVNINKLVRVFDKRPKIVFDSAVGVAVPYVALYGSIDGVGCDVSFMCCPPVDVAPQERVYTQGPKKGTVETVHHDEEDDE